LICVVAKPALAAELPEEYFRLMAAELPSIEKQLVRDSAADPKVLEAQGRILPGALMAAAVLYAKPHPANRAQGDRRQLDLAIALGDLLATESEQGSRLLDPGGSWARRVSSSGPRKSGE
jgi:hypothetical protein